MIPLMISTDTSLMDNTAVTKHLHSSYSLVCEAGKKIFERILFIEKRDSLRFDNIAILCGSGKNGSDGYALGKLLFSDKRNCKIIRVFPVKAEESVEAVSNFSEEEKAHIYGSDKAEEIIRDSELIIDCIFGTGFDPSRREPAPVFRRICKAVEESKAYVISADIPSGVSADSGEVSRDENGNTVCIKADSVCTFMHSKPGMEVTPGILQRKEIFVEVIEKLTEAEKVCEYRNFLTDDDIFKLLPERKSDSNKGTYGNLLCLCGSPDMPGAAMLAVSAALRMGVGLVRLCGIKDTLDILKSRISEPVFTTLPEFNGKYSEEAFEVMEKSLSKATSFLSGCGVGQDKSVLSLFLKICENTSCPLIIDADMITLLSDNDEFFTSYGERAVITPHPGEASKLLGTDIKTINSNRIYYARKMAEKFKCVVLLKGYRTVIASPDGKVNINPTGNSGMAKGGSGDVLSGIIASLAAQGLNTYDSAVLGAYIHGKAGDEAKERYGERSMLPTDTVDSISSVLKNR